MDRNPSTRSGGLLAWARLVRLPNLFTAVADPLAGWFVVGGGLPTGQVLLLTGASGCLYTAGIVLNDVFDYRVDCRERPERPLPRGDISRRAAGVVGAGLLAAGLALAAGAGPFTAGVAVFLAGVILFYNGWAKRFWLLGPLALGACRFANFLLGMRQVPAAMLWMPATLGVYVVILSAIARAEATRPAVRRVVKNLLLGIIVLDAVFVALTGQWAAGTLVLSLLVPAAALSRVFAMT
jgi:4-hydroxybenzoate polyprenyltransferase